MTKKEKFINLVENLLKDVEITDEDQDALAYFESMKAKGEKEKPQFTENGKAILTYMQGAAAERNNLFKAKDIGEGMFLSARVVSGAMRKLVTDGYVEKMGDSPITYLLSSTGSQVQFEQ